MTLASTVSQGAGLTGAFDAATGNMIGVASNTGHLVRFGQNIDHVVTRTVTSNTPTIAAGAGAGTSPGTTTITGNDVRGTIVVTTGTTATTAATLATITFGTAFAAAPIVILAPANEATMALAANKQPFISATATSTATILTGASALADATAYSWYYHVIG